MPILTPTDIHGTAVWLGVNANRDAGLQSSSLDSVEAAFEGFVGEAHGGLTRPSCSRVKLQYDRGTEIRNLRQLTIVSAEELAEIGEGLGLPGPVQPEWIGANLVIEGVPQLTMLPPNAKLIFENGVSIGVDMENGPCKYPAEVIEALHPGKGLRFPQAAMGKRGVTAYVERPGTLTRGERCRLHVPPLRIYEPAVKKRPAAAE